MIDIIKRIKFKKVILLGIGTLVILFLIFRTAVDARTFANTAREAQRTFIWYALLAFLPTFLLNPLRWLFVLKAYGYDLGFKRSFQAVTAASAFILIPGRLGDFMRSYFTKDTIPATDSIGSIIVEKVIDITILLLIATAGLTILGKLPYAVITFTAALGVVGAVILIKKLGLKLGLAKIQFIHKVAETVRIPEKPKYLVPAGLVSLVNWTTSIISTYFLFVSFQAMVPFTAVAAYLPITIFAGLIPVSLGGIGLRDSAMISLFIKYSTPAQSLAVGIGYSVLGYFLLMLIGIPFLMRYLMKSK